MTPDRPWTDADMAALSRRLEQAAQTFADDRDPGKRAIMTVRACIDAELLSRHPVLPGTGGRLRGAGAREALVERELGGNSPGPDEEDGGEWQ